MRAHADMRHSRPYSTARSPARSSVRMARLQQASRSRSFHRQSIPGVMIFSTVRPRARIATARIASSTCRRAATSSGSTFGTRLGPVRATPYREPGVDGPSIIELGAATHADLGVLRLPRPRAKRRVAGTVRWSDGRALGRVRVEVFEDRPGILGSISHGANVGADGAFSTELFEGRTYIVKAEAADPRGWLDRSTDEPIPPIAATAVTLTLEADRRDLVLVLPPIAIAPGATRR